MDIFLDNNESRNGLDSQYYNFLSIGKNAKKNNYAEAAVNELQDKYPPQDSYAKQIVMIGQLTALSASILQQRNSSKGKTRTALTGKLRAFDVYIPDMKNWGEELKKMESEEAIQQAKLAAEAAVAAQKVAADAEAARLEKEAADAAAATETTTTTGKITDATTKEQGQVVKGDGTAMPNATTSTVASLTASVKSNKTLWIVGGVALLLVGYMIFKKKA